MYQMLLKKVIYINLFIASLANDKALFVGATFKCIYIIYAHMHTHMHIHISILIHTIRYDNVSGTLILDINE